MILFDFSTFTVGVYTVIGASLLLSALLPFFFDMDGLPTSAPLFVPPISLTLTFPVHTPWSNRSTAPDPNNYCCPNFPGSTSLFHPFLFLPLLLLFFGVKYESESTNES